MSIASEIARLQAAKTAIRMAISGKGIEIESNASISTYAAAIDEIQVECEECEECGGGRTCPYCGTGLIGTVNPRFFWYCPECLGERGYRITLTECEECQHEECEECEECQP